jgi:ribosomal protein S6--L-glutamate ligase
MKIALISLRSRSSLMVLKALKNYFEEVADLDIRKIEVNLGVGKLDILYEGRPMEHFDCVYCRGSFRYAPLLRSITRGLSSISYMPIAATTFTIGHDKLLTHLALQRYKIPMPKTYLTSSPEAAKKILEKINYPIIMKFPAGTGGKGVMFAESFAAASSMLDALETLKQPFLIQEYIETGGVDLRLIVIDDKVAAAMKRKADVGEKRSNIHAGGAGEAYQPDAYTKKIAIETAQSIGAQICAVDILESPTGPLVIEANLSPGLQGITQATRIDIADKIAKFLYEKTKLFKESGKKKEAKKIFEELGIQQGKETTQQIIANLDFRSGRILLPKIVSDITKFSDKEELVIKARKGKLYIENSGTGK